MKRWPLVGYKNIFNYLVLSVGVDGEAMENFWSLDAYQYFHASKVGAVMFNEPASDMCFLKAEVTPRQAGIVQELCKSRGGRPGLSVLTSLLVTVDVKIYWTVLRHWSQLVPIICQLTSEDIKHQLIIIISQAVKATKHTAWVLVTSAGVVETAGCTCIAGQGESCSHAGAILRKVSLNTVLVFCFHLFSRIIVSPVLVDGRFRGQTQRWCSVVSFV